MSDKLNISSVDSAKSLLESIKALIESNGKLSKTHKEDLLEQYFSVKSILDLSKQIEDAFRMEIVERIESMNTKDVKATKLVSDRFEATLKEKIDRDFDSGKMAILAGPLSPKEYDTIQEVKIAWKWGELKKLQKQGGKVAKVITDATTEKFGKPSIEMKVRDVE